MARAKRLTGGAGGSPPRATLRHEKACWAQGHRLVAGVDEVGRGALFGPVVAAAVILDVARPIRGLQDSKALSPERRQVLNLRIRERAIAVSVAAVDSGRIDWMNIYQASRLAMLRAVQSLKPAPDCLLTDAMKIEVDLPQTPIIGGDAQSRSIAAASIVAKVERDRWMTIWDEAFPRYGLASNKGYSSPHHLAALEQCGPSPLHRLSFEPVARTTRFAARFPDAQLSLLGDYIPAGHAPN